MDQNAQPSTQGTGMDQAKLIAILGYVLPFLFFLPMVMDELKNNEFAKFHANQHLNLLIFLVVGNVAATVLSVVLIGFLILPIVAIGGLVYMVLGIMNVVNGTMKPLPLIGQFKLIK